jgi:hypothetical protein
MLHRNSVYNHILENWTFATAALRITAGTYVAGDVGKVAYQTDNGTYWRLTATTPTWEQLSPWINYSTALQSPSATVRTYITGSDIGGLAPIGKLNVGTILRWHFNMTKTGAGSATSTFDIAFGTAGTTSDTARVSFTKPVGTTVPDEAWVEIECIIRSINASTGVAVGEFNMTHNLAATGHATIPNVVVNTISGNFDTTTPTHIGICITSGASDAISIQQVTVEAWNLG